MKSLRLLDRSISFHRVFVRLTGSVTGALLLSQAVYWQNRTRAGDGWWWKTQEDWTEETGMSRHELATAKKACEPFLDSKRAGIPCKTWWRVNADAIQAAIDELQEDAKPQQNASLPESGQLDFSADPSSRNPDDQFAGIRQSTNGHKMSSEMTYPPGGVVPIAEAPTAEDIFKAYPKKVAKPAALKAIQKAIKAGADPAFLLERTKLFGQTYGKDLSFCPYPATWYNQERFNDDPGTWKRYENGKRNRPEDNPLNRGVCTNIAAEPDRIMRELRERGDII